MLTPGGRRVDSSNPRIALSFDVTYCELAIGVIEGVSMGPGPGQGVEIAVVARRTCFFLEQPSAGIS